MTYKKKYLKYKLKYFNLKHKQNGGDIILNLKHKQNGGGIISFLQYIYITIISYFITAKQRSVKDKDRMASRWRYIIRKALQPKKRNSMHSSHIRYGHPPLDTSGYYNRTHSSHTRYGHPPLDTSDNFLPSAALASASINDNPSKASVRDDID